MLSNLRSTSASLAPFLLLFLPPPPPGLLLFLAGLLLRPRGRRTRWGLLSFLEHAVILPAIATLADLPFLARCAVRHHEITGSVAGSNETNYAEPFRRVER